MDVNGRESYPDKVKDLVGMFLSGLVEWRQAPIPYVSVTSFSWQSPRPNATELSGSIGSRICNFSTQDGTFDVKDAQLILCHLVNGVAGQVIVTAENRDLYPFQNVSRVCEVPKAFW